MATKTYSANQYNMDSFSANLTTLRCWSASLLPVHLRRFEGVREENPGRYVAKWQRNLSPVKQEESVF
jgi:hypothetical protein